MLAIAGPTSSPVDAGPPYFLHRLRMPTTSRARAGSQRRRLSGNCQSGSLLSRPTDATLSGDHRYILASTPHDHAHPGIQHGQEGGMSVTPVPAANSRRRRYRAIAVVLVAMLVPLLPAAPAAAAGPVGYV